jgi:hypothetical protein
VIYVAAPEFTSQASSYYVSGRQSFPVLHQIPRREDVFGSGVVAPCIV